MCQESFSGGLNTGTICMIGTFRHAVNSDRETTGITWACSLKIRLYDEPKPYILFTTFVETADGNF